MRAGAQEAPCYGALAGVVAALAFLAAGCGGDDGSSSASGEDWQISGLGSTLDEIQTMAKDEGEVNLVKWPGYADKSWADEFTKQTGCKVNTKDGASSDDMVDLMRDRGVRRGLRFGRCDAAADRQGRRCSCQLRPDAELR